MGQCPSPTLRKSPNCLRSIDEALAFDKANVFGPRSLRTTPHFVLDGLTFAESLNGNTFQRRVVEEDGDAEEYWQPPQEHIEMVDAGCASGVEYYCYRMNVRSESPIYSENPDELKQMLIEDIMENIDCEPWDEMSESDLNEWYIWFGYVND